MRHTLHVLGPVFLVLLAACGGDPPPTPAPPEPLAPVPTTARVYYDNGGGYQDSVRLVVRDAETWAEVWERATSTQSAPPPRPAVDFSDEIVLVVGAGRMTPEDEIRVDSVGIRPVRTPEGGTENHLTAVVRTIEGCGRFDADAYPLEIVRVRGFDGPVDFVERRDRRQDCGFEAEAAPGADIREHDPPAG